LNLERVAELLRRPLVFDGRNIYTPERMERAGLEYYPVGGGRRNGADRVSPRRA